VTDAEFAAYVADTLAEHERQCHAMGLVLPRPLRDMQIRAMQRHATPAVDTATVDSDLLTMTYAEAAKRLSVSLRTVVRLTSAGAIRSVRVGGSSRIAVEDLRTYVDQLRRVTAA